MKLVYCAIAFFLIALAGCKGQGRQHSELEQAGMTAVRAQAKDPESVQFRGVRTVDVTTVAGPGQIVCGDFNAKNGFGGYNGFESFAWEPNGKLITKDTFPNDSAQFVETVITELCSGRLTAPAA